MTFHVSDMNICNMKNLVNLQTHKHSKTCRKKGKAICRFGYPIPPMPRTCILEPHSTETSEEDYDENASENYKKIALIGSGGNINKLFKMSGRTEGKPISYIYLSAQYEFLKKMTYDQRVSELSLNEDRADVIIPATKIYLSAMKWSGARKIYVPKIGLADGIVKSLFYNKI